MDHHSLSPVPLSDGTAMSSDNTSTTSKSTSTATADMSDLTDLAELASAADAMDTGPASGGSDSADADAEGTTDTADTPNDGHAPTDASPSSDTPATAGTPADTPAETDTSGSVRPSRSRSRTSTRTRAGAITRTGRPLKINYPKKRVSVACDVCRARKTRCDARKPACSFCSQLGIDCVYRRAGASVNNNSTTASTPTPKNDNPSKTDIVARLGRLESLLREKETVSSPSPAPVPAPAPVAIPVAVPGAVSVASPLAGIELPTGNSPALFPPPTPSTAVPFSVASPYVGGHSPEQYHHPTQQYEHPPQHHDLHPRHVQHHHQPQIPPHPHHESLSPYAATPSDHGLHANIAANIAVNEERTEGPLPLFGYRLDSLSRLGPDAASLPSLHALCHLDVDAELETELFGQSTAATGLLSSSGLEEQLLDLSPRRCWSLEQAFSRDVLPWCPIIEQHECAALVARAAEDGFPRGRLETAVALLVLALGSFARESGGDSTSTRKSGGPLPGIDYFHAGRQVMHNAAGASGASARYSIMRVQCDLLVTFYFLFSLKPILAFEVLSSAGLRLLMLLQLRSSSKSATARQTVGSPASATSGTTATGSLVDGHDDPTYDERLHRAYWTCYLLEHELQAYVSFSARLLQERREFVPLPLSNYEEPGMYWFLSEIALRGICSSMQDDPGYYSKKHRSGSCGGYRTGGRYSSSGIGTGGVAWNEHMLDAPMLVEEVTLQLLEWHANLAAPVSFPLDEATPSGSRVPILRPLLDPHKVFLRAQFYAVQATLRWPFVVQLLTQGTSGVANANPTTPGPGVDGAAASLHYAVLHVYAVEPLMQDRHLMLFANIAGLFCVTMLLLCAHGLPQLAAIQHPGTEAAVRAALTSLKIWQNEPNVKTMVARVEALARSKGVAIL